MRALAPLERLHVALAIPVAVGCVVGFPLLGIDDGIPRNTWQTIAGVATTAGAFAWWLAAAGLAWFRRHRRRSEVERTVPGRAVAALTGALLGLFAGLYEDPEPLGMHLGAGCTYFALLPAALVSCVPRRPAWRPFADIALLMAGVEAGAQLGLSYAKWGELRWWDDVSGINLVYAEGAFAVAVVWFLVTYRVRRRTVTRLEGEDAPPPRKPA